MNLSNNTTPSAEPFISGPVKGVPLVVWADSTGSNYDIKYKFPLSGENGTFVSSTPQSHHPGFGSRSISGGSRVLLHCTDGTTSLYQVANGQRDFLISKVVAESEFPVGERLMPGDFALLQNHPNPSNPSTVIKYELPMDASVTLKVYDVLGKEVAILVDGFKQGGYHQVSFDARSLASGVYFYRLTAGGRTVTRRMLLMK